jgi:hypothetical protein
MEPSENTPIKATLEAETKDELLDLLKDLPVAARLKLLNKALPGVLHTSNTYFHEKYALEIIEDLKLLIADTKRETVLFYPYADYQWRKKTVYNYVNESFRFIVMHMDNKEKDFARLREVVDVSPGKDGVYIKWKKRFSKDKVSMRAQIIKAADMEEQEAEPDLSVLEDNDDIKISTQSETYKSIKNELINFMENTTEKGKLWEKKDVVLSVEQVNELNDLFEQSEVFGGAVTVDAKTKTATIKCRRIS